MTAILDRRDAIAADGSQHICRASGKIGSNKASFCWLGVDGLMAPLLARIYLLADNVRRNTKTSPSDVMEKCKKALTLYRAKAEGRGRWSLYDAGAAAEQVARYELAAALPDALERGEFSLMYQPIVRLAENVAATSQAAPGCTQGRLRRHP